MSSLAHTFLDPFIGTLTILALMAAIGIPLHLFLEKTPAGSRFKAMTPWMEWYDEDEVEAEYTNFRIHPSNYIKVPNHR